MIYDFSLKPIDERMYIMLSEKEALIIDPFVNDDAIRLLDDNEIQRVLILLTHEHFDHITGVDFYREKYNGRVVCSKECEIGIKDVRKNLSAHFEIFYLMNPTYDYEQYRQMCSKPFTCTADESFEKYGRYEWKGHMIELYSTPGHSPGSSCILLDKKHLFTGDSLVNGFEVITRYPGGSKKQYEEYALPFLKGVDCHVMVYPGHGEKAPLSHWSFS